ncbi:MAG: ABC transporter ATP-binding protein [Boseongicola sp. SB0670_bin_30]|nr:ABC transporter ATP-binding protein [Boseongicola sp. SB0670_bin_30]
MNALNVTDLSIDFPTARGVVHALTDLSFSVARGRRLGIIGESGSGKTTTALAVMRMLASPGFVSGGSIRLADLDVLALPEEEMRRARLRRVSYIPQGAMNSLNPVMRVKDQLKDAIVAHEGRTEREVLRSRIENAFAGVGLPEHVGSLYPHELSGGMKQRVCIALGVILNPELIIADEPTSALDVVTQRQVMQTLKDVQQRIGAALILIGHDMGLMAQSVDELVVLKDGILVEHGDMRRVIENPRHPYTRELVASVPLVGGESFLANSSVAPDIARPRERLPLLEFEIVHKDYGGITALHPMSFSLHGDEPKIISIVGQSGSGKSTMGSIMLGFNPPSKGRVLFERQDVARMSPQQSRDFRKNVQAVFQDPYACFNPFYRVDHALSFPFRRFGYATSDAQVRDRMHEACQAVGLDPALILRRYPHELSGGQRQRLIVARALMLNPKLLIADEPVSMVDASLRATILKNIYDLKDRHGISIFYITHDLATAYHVSDYVMVLYKGQVVEAGPPKEVIGDPQHPYTQLLIASIPWPDPDREWGGTTTAAEDIAALDALDRDAPTVFRGDVPGFRLDVGG